MARSRLYENALSALGSGRAPWEAAANRIASIDGPDPTNQSGSETIRMIESEEQLSADPANADSVLMTQVLQTLAGTPWPMTPREFEKAYKAAVEAHRLRGQPIHLSPRTLRRYLNGRTAHGFLEQFVDALRRADDRLAQRLEGLIRNAVERRSYASWDGVIRFLRRPNVWAILVDRAVPLSRGRGVFVTFDLDTPTARASARWLHAALALWLPLDDCFLELSYPVADGDVLRFPTFADSGWFRHFVGAPAGQPCGWTRPHASTDPAPDRQPEAVTEPPDLSRLASPNDLRAVPP